MYARILVPTDGSVYSEAVCAHGVAIAEAMDSFVSFLFVMDTLAAYHDGMTSTADARKALTAQGRATLERALNVAKAAGVGATGELIEGSPVDVIVRRAADFELVVMGSHRKGFVKRLMVGSVSRRLLRRLGRRHSRFGPHQVSVPAPPLVLVPHGRRMDGPVRHELALTFHSQTTGAL